MSLPPEAIEDFRKAYFKDFGLEISKEQAEELGTRLITLFSVIYKPLPKHNHDDISPNS